MAKNLSIAMAYKSCYNGTITAKFNNHLIKNNA